MEELATFYAKLYGSCDNFSDDEIERYMGRMILPTLTQEESMELEAPFTLEELGEAAASFSTGKAPGDDGIPMEVYAQYGEVILPKLLEVFNASFKIGEVTYYHDKGQHSLTT